MWHAQLLVGTGLNPGKMEITLYQHHLHNSAVQYSQYLYSQYAAITTLYSIHHTAMLRTIYMCFTISTKTHYVYLTTDVNHSLLISYRQVFS